MEEKGPSRPIGPEVIARREVLSNKQPKSKDLLLSTRQTNTEGDKSDFRRAVAKASEKSAPH